MKITDLSLGFVGISYKQPNYFRYGKNTLSENNGKGDTIVNFESLELEEGGEETPSKASIMLSTLKEKLEPAEFKSLMDKLGVGDDLSNAELLEEIKALFQGAKKGEEEEVEDEEEEDKEMADFKTFVKECMQEGKSLKECTEEAKEKYPEPSKEEIAEVEQLAAESEPKDKEMADRLTELENELAKLKQEKALGEVSAKVDMLVKDQHLAPVQRDGAIKLAAQLSPKAQDEFLNFFRNTQKFTVHADVGKTSSDKPGGGAGEITPERRQALIKAHGLDGLIADKADKSALPWEA